MSDYIQINNEEAEALICALENSCKSHRDHFKTHLANFFK